MAKRILIVDDDDHIREVAEVSLSLVGAWEVTTAASGHEGLRRALTEDPDAILLDVMMPGMDGPATVQGLRANPATAGIPVVLLTAKVQGADRTRLAGLDVSGLIAKPFDPLELPGLVDEALGWSA